MYASYSRLPSYDLSYPPAFGNSYAQPSAFGGQYSPPSFDHSYQSPASSGYFPPQLPGVFFTQPLDAYYAASSAFATPPVVKEEEVTTSFEHAAQSESSPTSTSMKSPGGRTRIPPGTLCAICSDLANAYHYGVASCNGCKTFFRRTIVDGHAGTLRCQFEGRCEVSKEVRNACRRCRFDKCVLAGMDSTAFQGHRDSRLSTVGSRGSVSGRPKIPEGALCLICSDFATGYHFGASSCHGCKSFFRRTIVAGRNFVCERDGTCAVQKRDSTSCRGCRFNKCLEAGMSVEAIQGSRDKRGPRKMKSAANATAPNAHVTMPTIRYEEPFCYASAY
ncbi:Retinoic acid receptor RXR-alpha [Aphelenchoides avenae]|nr:Retinoic acid receptor RXR-alpha [Aphelenchus avenae]